MEKLPISIGILSWNSGQSLIDTLLSYFNNGLFDIVKDATILFQECSKQDIEIADHFSIKYIDIKENIGIGKGFITLAENCKEENILLLEHDWNLIEDKNITYQRLSSGIEFLNNGTQVVKYRHRLHPGFPLFTYNAYKDNELNHYDNEIGLQSPHLLDCIHWITSPHELFDDKIKKEGNYFISTSRWANWTNNPCLFKKDFYIKTVSPFCGNGVDLEGKIGPWWARQNFKVAHGEGLFTHRDLKKYGK